MLRGGRVLCEQCWVKEQQGKERMVGGSGYGWRQVHAVTAACAVWLPAYALRDFGRSVKAALLLWQSTHLYLRGVVM